MLCHFVDNRDQLIENEKRLQDFHDFSEFNI